MNLQAIKDAALQIKDKLTKPPLTDILIEATSNENWNTPTKLLQEISEASYGYTQCDTIMKFIWKRLDSDNREWRRILKTLNLIEYLTKNGAPRCVGEFRDSIFKIRSFSDFILIEQSSDKGLSIRDKSKQLVDLLCDDKLIEEERDNAKKIRERLAAAGGIGAIGSNTNYQGYGRDTYKNDSFKGYGNDSQKNEATQNNSNGSNNTTKSDQQTYQSKYGIWDDGVDKNKKAETNNNNNNNTIQWNVPQPEVIQAPFQEIIQKLAKPNEKWDVPVSKQIQQQFQQIQQAKQNTQPQQQTQKQNVIDIFDFEPQQNQQPQAQQIQPPQPPPSQKSNNNDWGSFDNVNLQAFTQQQAQSQVLLPLDSFNQQPQQQSIQHQSNNLFGQEQQQQQHQQQQLQSLQQQQQLQQQSQQFYQQPQNQQSNLNLIQLNYQQSLLVNYNQSQYNSMNNQQYYFQVNQQQMNYNQQKLQQQQPKQEDLVFGDFISAQQTKQTNNNQTDLLGMLDLKKEKEELESKKLIQVGNQPIQQNQMYPDIDTFSFNYQKKQQTFNNYQYPQGR